MVSPMRRALLVGSILLAAACGGRRDTSEIAVAMAPFDELRGIPFSVLRSGGARALRRNVSPMMGVGLSERIGEYEVTYVVPVFDSASGEWPVEDALVLEISAARNWASDSAARAEWLRTIRAISSSTSTTPRCLARVSVTGSVDSAATTPPAQLATFATFATFATLAEFDRGDSLTLGAEFVAGALASDSSAIPPQTQLVIRRTSLSAPAWTEAPCPST